MEKMTRWNCDDIAAAMALMMWLMFLTCMTMMELGL